MGVGGGLRELRSTGCEPHPVLERQRPGRDEGGDLTERVSGERDRRLDALADGLPRHQRGEQHGKLRLSGPGQLLGGSVEEKRGEGLPQGGFGPIDDAPGRMVAPRRAHAGGLGPLTGEDDGNAHVLASARTCGFCSDQLRSGRVTPSDCGQENGM
jgi:hypothetical protein